MQCPMETECCHTFLEGGNSPLGCRISVPALRWTCLVQKRYLCTFLQLSLDVAHSSGLSTNRRKTESAVHPGCHQKPLKTLQGGNSSRFDFLPNIFLLSAKLGVKYSACFSFCRHHHWHVMCEIGNLFLASSLTFNSKLRVPPAKMVEKTQFNLS